MTTLSPLSLPKASSDQPGASDTASMSPLAIVQKQLAVLAEMAIEGQTEAAALQAEVADLTHRLSAATARITRLETALSNQARMLNAVCASLQETQHAFVMQQQVASHVAPATQSNGAPETPAAQPEPPARPTPTSAPLRAAPAPAHQEMAAVSEEARSAPAPTPSTLRETPLRESQPQAPVRPVAQPTASAPARAPETTREPQVPVRPVAQPTAPVPARVADAAPEPPVEQPTARPAAPTPAPVAPQAAPERALNDNRPRVQRGSTVEVSFEDGSTETYTIVRQNEANPTQNHIGDNSPLGSALIGACVGEKRTYRVRLSAPEQTVQVRAIA